MKLSLPAVLAMAAFAAPLAVHAEGFVSGNQLMQACSSGKVLDDRQCIGFIAGAVDEITANPTLKGIVCPLPAKTELKDVKAALVRYGRAHTDQVGLPAARLLNAAIKDKYPCG